MIIETIGISYLVNRHYGNVRPRKSAELAFVVALAMALNEMILDRYSAPTSTKIPNVKGEQNTL